MQPATGIERTEVLQLCRDLLLPRLIEEKMLRLIRQGRISKWFSGYGQEAIAVGCVRALEDGDYLLPMHRNLGVWTTRGVPLKKLFCQLMGKAGGYTRGRDRTFHFGLPEHRIVGMISHLGAMLPVATGLGLASRLKNERFVALSFTGEGATREGDFHEALSLAAVWKLPVIFVVENNGYGLSTPATEAIPVKDIADAASGYGMPGRIVDGNNVFAVTEAVSEAAVRARNGDGPTLLEMKTFRMRGHEEASGMRYVPKTLVEEWSRRDPIEIFLLRVWEEQLMDLGEVDDIRLELREIVEEAAEFALTQPDITGEEETELDDVYAPSADPVLPPASAQRTEKRFIDALSEGLHNAMESDDRVVLLGQDIAEYGGVFKVTEGFLERYGKDRVRNTPIIESGIIGAALGMALEGLKPVVEMQYADFISCGFNQIVNNLAPTHYRWGAPVNVTIRAPFGGGIGAGPFHSQSMEAWFTHVPGLKVVVPSSPEDVKGLIRAAIHEPNPVLFFEHKLLYRAVKGSVPDSDYAIPIGKARIARQGSHATIVSWGAGVVWALEEAETFTKEGIDLEVIDLRTLVPWDRQAVIDSVRKTNRLMVLHEASRTGGFGGEIAAELAETAFEHLDAPPVRIGSAFMPIPFARQLENEVYSARARFSSGLRRLLAY
jgi:2-oxoisovalerate dehydrogenase E1 component